MFCAILYLKMKMFFLIILSWLFVKQHLNGGQLQIDFRVEALLIRWFRETQSCPSRLNANNIFFISMCIELFSVFIMPTFWDNKSSILLSKPLQNHYWSAGKHKLLRNLFWKLIIVIPVQIITLTSSFYTHDITKLLFHLKMWDLTKLTLMEWYESSAKWRNREWRAILYHLIQLRY